MLSSTKQQAGWSRQISEYARIEPPLMLSHRGEPGSLVGTRLSVRGCILVLSERFISDHDHSNNHPFRQSSGRCGTTLRTCHILDHPIPDCAGGRRGASEL